MACLDSPQQHFSPLSLQTRLVVLGNVVLQLPQSSELLLGLHQFLHNRADVGLAFTQIVDPLLEQRLAPMQRSVKRLLL